MKKKTSLLMLCTIILSIIMVNSVVAIDTSKIIEHFSFDTDATGDKQGITTATNDATYVSNASCLLNGCYQFISDDAIAYTDSTFMSQLDGNTTGAITLWFYSFAKDNSNSDFLVSMWDGDRNDLQEIFYSWYSNEEMTFRQYTGGVKKEQHTNPANVLTWNFIVMQNTGSDFACYINGGATDYCDGGGSFPFPNTMWWDDIGGINEVQFGNGQGSAEYLIGYMDEITYWNDALNSSERTELYNSGSGISISFLASLTGDFISPTPANNSVNNTDVDLQMNCSDATATVDIFFENVNPPTTKVVDNSSTWSYNVTGVSEDTYYYIGRCYKDGTYSENTTVRTWTYDTTSPTITNNSPRGFSGNNLLLNYTLSDNNQLFAYEINVTQINNSWGLYNETNKSLTQATYTVDKTIDATTWTKNVEYNITLKVSDSHTDDYIKPYDIKYKVNELEFLTEEGNNISILVKDDNATMTATKLEDRYIFDLDFIDNKEDKKRTFAVRSNNGKKIEYIDNSNYKAHFVIIGENLKGNWIDFMGTDETPTIIKINDYEYEISFPKLKDKITFQSIGGLNTNSQSETFCYGNCNITFKSQVPADIDILNVLQSYLNITYNVSNFYDYETTKIYHKVNDSNGQVNYVNGSLINGWKNDYLQISKQENFNWILGENEVYPYLSLLDLNYLENNPHLEQTLGNNNYLKTRIVGMNPNKDTSFFEIMLNSTGSLATNIFYCNSSYSTGNPNINNNCVLFGNIPANTPYNHEHSNYSSHNVLSLGIINQSIGNVGITNTSYFIIEGEGGLNTPTIYYLNNDSGLGNTELSTDNGVSYSQFSGTVDLHIHQYDGTETFSYYVCANETFNGEEKCTTTREDLLGFANLPPSSPIIINPINNTYSNTSNINISYLPAVSPNSYPIETYNISLLDTNETFISHIVDNGGNLSYDWNISSIAIGNYRIRVDAYDNLSQNSSAFSQAFTISGCVEDWTDVNNTCRINDTYFREYVDANSCETYGSLPVDNGTYQSCNYCSEDLEMINDTCDGEFQNTYYVDNNQATCCDVTGLLSDCSILYSPYNETIQTNCSVLVNDFNCSYDSQPILKTKMNVVCEMPDNKTYSCVNNIKWYDPANANFNLLATYPEYKQTSLSILALASEQDTRESFIPENRLVNTFYKKKNLRTDTKFITEVLCTSNDGTSIKSQYFITPTYDKPDWFLNRTIWAGNNAQFLILAFIIISILLGLTALAIKKIKGK